MKNTDFMASYEIHWQDSLNVFETVPDLYLILSSDLQVLTASNTYLKAISASRDEIRSLPAQTTFVRYGLDNPGDLEIIKADLEMAVRTGEAQFMPVQRFNLLMRAGTEPPNCGYWQVSNTPVLDEHGNILYIIHKVNDITDIINKEKAFQASLDEDLKKIEASSDFLRKAEEAGNTGSYRFDLRNKDIWFSDGMYKLIGYEPQAFVPSLEYLDSISHPDDINKVNLAIENAVATKQSYEYVRRIFSPLGEMRCIFCKGRVVEDELGNPLHILGVSHDITKKIKQEEELEKALDALSKSKDLLQSIFDSTLIGMSLLKPVRNDAGKIIDFSIALASKELEKETRRADLIGKLYTEEYPGVKTTGLFDLMLKVMETGESEHLEYYYPFEGFDKWYSCTFVKLDDGLVASNLDITPTRAAEAKIRELEQVQKLEIFKATIRTQEEERNRIAEDLRNGIGQLLYAVKMNLRHLDAGAALANTKDFVETKDRTDQILGEAIKEIRRLSHLMTPSILEHFGLEETIKDLCKQFSPKLKITSNFFGIIGRFDRYLEVSIYRMAQELLLNIVDHAKASKATLELRYQNNHVLLTICDDGPGILPQQINCNALGLESLLNRVGLLNGKIEVESTESAKITIKIPVNLHA